MRILIAGIACLLASSLSAFDLIDTVQSLREQAWESEYIPESTVPVVLLTEYDEFEVVELFRVETIEELEASLTDGYPYPWLEETLKDESIPWEDRYWLNCRMRGFIAENLHTFYREDGTSIVIPCDWVRAGEEYWRETLIVNPIGEAPEILELDMPHIYRESGYMVNLFGGRIGSIAIADSMVRLSRDGGVGICQTGWRNEYSVRDELYICFLYPDGSFIEIPVESLFYNKGAKVGISHDGTLAAFTASNHGLGERPIENRLYLFDENAQEIARYEIEGILTPRTYPVISPDNRLIGLNMYRGGYMGSQLIDASTGEVLYRCSMAIRHPYFSQNSERVSFSGQSTPVVVLDNSSLEISREYPLALVTQNEGGYAFIGTSISNNSEQLLGISVSGIEFIRDARSLSDVLQYDNNTGVRFLYDGSIVESIPGYNGGALSPNGHFAWLFETACGQNSSHPFYGSKCMIVALEGVE